MSGVERNRDAYKTGSYNETQVRREFIDRFFKALGWDIDNEQGYAEACKGVIHEDAIKSASPRKRPTTACASAARANSSWKPNWLKQWVRDVLPVAGSVARQITLTTPGAQAGH